MLVMRQKENNFPDRKLENLAVRRKRQEIEGREAVKDYRLAQQAARDRMAALRQQRLAREAQLKEQA
jgi:hypothetical protein